MGTSLTAKQSFILDLKKQGNRNKDIAEIVGVSANYVSVFLRSCERQQKEYETTQNVRLNPSIHPEKIQLNWPSDTRTWDQLTKGRLGPKTAWEDALMCRIGCSTCEIEWSYCKTVAQTDKWYNKHNKEKHET